MTIFDTITTHLEQQIPFVVYRKPNEKKLSGFFQKSKELFLVETFSASGFVFSPFDNREPSILIPKKESDFFQEELLLTAPISSEASSFVSDSTSKEIHLQLVKKAILEIQKKRFQKVVLSRKEKQKLVNFELVNSYKKLLQNYPNAFGYVWYHPKVGLWMGATPETLLTISDGHFETMSLAGTQMNTGSADIQWQEKEIEEQQLVTTSIRSQINEITRDLIIEKTETITAGNLLHLRTKISGDLIDKQTSLKTLINALHPTPAVCGLPRLETKNFILENENYHRSFYTGYLGELNLKTPKSKIEKSALYVNLRCMEIQENNAILYIGGGITKDSDAEKEWEETVSKSKVMKAVL